MSSKPDYAKLSLYLGGVSVVGAGLYWFWQYRNAKKQDRYRAKYQEAKKAIRELQQDFGLPATGKLDESTKALLFHLGGEGYAM